jgi:hypothetical protein
LDLRLESIPLFLLRGLDASIGSLVSFALNDEIQVRCSLLDGLPLPSKLAFMLLQVGVFGVQGLKLVREVLELLANRELGFLLQLRSQLFCQLAADPLRDLIDN